MQISKITLRGFRNFKDATINLSRKSLIIGHNEVGKSNMLYALRILLDRRLSQADLEPQDSDFYAHEETNEIEILVQFSDVCEDCVLAKLREHVSDEGMTYLAYQATRDPVTRRKEYSILVGREENELVEVETRFYLRVLNLEFMGSRRNLQSFIRRERKYLLQDARDEREEEETERDNETLGDIQSKLRGVNEDVASLVYVSKATDSLNEELDDLSIQNAEQEVIFDTGAADPSLFVDNLELSSRVGEKTLAIGGDGRINQIHLALWTARKVVALDPEEEPLNVTIFCIEEPEAHLHPHQQRKLANYLSETLDAQVVITTHSPQITCEFSPDSIIRLYDNEPDTLAAGNGINPFIEEEFINFGFRLNIIRAEAFFSSLVLLVEGPSEELFYKALASKVGVDLDRLNISVLMISGIGFRSYISLLDSLRIGYVIRTDNDVFKIPKQDAYRFAGVQRGVEIYRMFFDSDEDFDRLLEQHEDKLKDFPTPQPPPENLDVVRQIIQKLEDFNIFVADVDLEHDLHNALRSVTSDFFGPASDNETIIQRMQKQKAINMFAFLTEHSDDLADLRDHSLAKPLLRCQQIVESLP
jgi:putative ATP-dependent endonuclease of the OLD family